MQYTPLVSIIVPTYNREELLPIAVESVLNQSFENWELLIVDDRSTDGTPELVANLCRSDQRIRYLKNTRPQGPSGARNDGLANMNGRYVAFLDSDDEWEPFHLERMVYYLETYPQRIDLMTANPLRRVRSSGDVYNHDELKIDLFPHERLEDAYLLEEDGLFNRALNSRIITTQTIVAKREVLEKVPWDEEVGAGEDCLWPLEVAYYRFRIAHLQEYHVTYWAHGDNLSNCSGEHDPARMIPVYEGFVKFHEALLSRLDLTPEQRQLIESNLANLVVWNLGYNGYLALHQFKNARSEFLKGIKLRPFNYKFWKVYLGSFIKELRYKS